MAAKTYLDDNGNPTASPTYLDASGVPIATAQQAVMAKMTPSGQPPPQQDTRGLLKSAYDTLPGAGGQWADLLTGPAYAIQHPIDSLDLLGQAASDAQTKTFQRGFERMNAGDKSGGALQVGEGFIPLVGPALATSSNQAQTGNMQGAIGTALGIGGQLAMGTPEAQGGLVSALAKARAIRNPLTPNPVESLASNFRSTGGIDPYQAAKQTVPMLQDAAADLGMKKSTMLSPTATGSAAGRTGFDAFNDVLDHAMSKHEAEFQQVYDPLKSQPVSNAAAAGSARSVLNNAASQLDPAAAGRVNDIASRLGKLNTLEDLNNARQFLNSELKSYYQRNSAGQMGSALEEHALKAANDQIRNTLYQEIERRSGVNVRGLKQNESNLIDLKSLWESRRPGLSADEAASQGSTILERFREGKSAWDSTVGAVVKPNPAAKFNQRVNRALFP